MAKKAKLSKKAMRGAEAGLVLVTDDNIQAAKAFVLSKWRARAEERNEEDRRYRGEDHEPAPLPIDLSMACNFAALFAWKVFGGRLRANREHAFVEGPGGQLIDLTIGAAMFDTMRAAGIDPHAHDPVFFDLDPTYKDQLSSCLERVDAWVEEFLAALG